MPHIPELRSVYDKVGRQFDKIASAATFSQHLNQILARHVLCK